MMAEVKLHVDVGISSVLALQAAPLWHLRLFGRSRVFGHKSINYEMLLQS